MRMIRRHHRTWCDPEHVARVVVVVVVVVVVLLLLLLLRGLVTVAGRRSGAVEIVHLVWWELKRGVGRARRVPG